MNAVMSEDLVVEVSQSSLRYHRNRKLRLYARHGIPEYWIVDLATPRLHVFHTPDEGNYAHSDSTEQPTAIALQAMPELRIDLTGLFEGL